MNRLNRLWNRLTRWVDRNPVEFVLLLGLSAAVVSAIVMGIVVVTQPPSPPPPETVVCELAQDIYELVDAQNSAQNDEAVTRRLDEVDTSISRYCPEIAR